MVDKKNKDYAITITLDSEGYIPPGFNKAKLVEDIEAEFHKLRDEAQLSIQKKELPLPKGAQGDPTLEYLLELLTNPDLAKFYAKTLLYTLNQIFTSYNSGNSEGKEKKKGEKGKNIINAIILFMGKELSLPNLQKKIEEFLEDIDF